MPVIQKRLFPFRFPVKKLAGAYASLGAAFAAHDYLYVSRFGKNDPELRGCALLMLGNKAGGQRVLEENKIHTAHSCFYRAFGEWQHGDSNGARRWLTEGRSLPGNNHLPFEKLSALIEKQEFSIVFHCDFDGRKVADVFQQLPGFRIAVTQQLKEDGPGTLPIGQPLASILPDNFKPDLVLLDDLKLVPLGIGDLGAPVAVNVHDNEWYDELLDEVMPEIDFLSTGCTSHMIEMGRPFCCPASIYFYHFPTKVVSGEIAKSFHETTKRTTDLYYSSSGIGHDGYRYKRQEILALTKVSEKFSVEIFSKIFASHEYIQNLHKTRFTISSIRDCNTLPSRAIEAIVCGTLHLVEEENGFPYLFSEFFACFPTYRHTHIAEDVEKCLENYDKLIGTLRDQLPQFVVEFESLLPTDDKIRAARYLRYLLFMTHVEANTTTKHVQKNKSKRAIIYTNEYDFLLPYPKQLRRLIDQTPKSHALRRAFAKGRLAMAENKPREASLAAILEEIEIGLHDKPDSPALHYTRGLCERFQGREDDADKSFSQVTSGKMKLDPMDPVTTRMGIFNSFYWIQDARIRARCPEDIEPLTSADDVMISYAWANRAEIAFIKGHTEIAADYSMKAVELFSYNDAAQRVYLRAAFALSGGKKWADDFLQSFENAYTNDYTFLHDFAAPAIHIYTLLKRDEDASRIRRDLGVYLRRVEMQDYEYHLYPEFVPLLKQYGLPHQKLKA